MNKWLSKYACYYPATLAKGERVVYYLSIYEATQWEKPAYFTDDHIRRLNYLIDIAYDRTAHYKMRFDNSGVNPEGVNSLSDIESLPFVTKEDIASNGVSMEVSPSPLLSTRKTTGGSTGQAVTIKKNPSALARERAATWRSYRWAGIDIGDKQARFWGVPFHARDRLIYKIADAVSNRIRLSAFELNEKLLESYYHTVERFKPAYLYGYVSMIETFRDYLTEKKLQLPDSLRCIITTSEVLTPETRSRMESAFDVPVFNEYGCGEVGSIAHECEHGSMHIMAENLIVEIDTTASQDPASGEIVVTDLHNTAMPLIRYRLGDYATLSPEPCKCGRGLPVIEKIHGRAYDMIVDPDGNKYHPEVIMYIFEDIKARHDYIRQFQVIQRSRDTLEVTLVLSSSARTKTENEITRLVRTHIHSGYNVLYNYKDAIPREPSGKLRLIKNEMTA